MLARLGDPIFLLGRVIVRTTRGYSFEVNPKYIRRRDGRASSGGLETCGDSRLQEDANDRVAGRAGRTRKRTVYRTAVGKLSYMCEERADITYSVKETARKIMYQ